MKEHLQGDYYEWNAGGNAHFMKELTPTRNRFDRFDGNCVLHMLNLFNQLVESLTLTDGQRIESLIANELPLTFSSEMSVFNWLKGRFIYSATASKAQ